MDARTFTLCFKHLEGKDLILLNAESPQHLEHAWDLTSAQ